MFSRTQAKVITQGVFSNKVFRCCSETQIARGEFDMKYFKQAGIVSLMVSILMGCDTSTTDSSPINNAINTDQFNATEKKAVDGICNSLQKFDPYAIGKDHNFQFNFTGCNAESRDYSLTLSVQFGDSRFYYEPLNNGVNLAQYFSGIEQELYGVMSYFCKQSPVDPNRNKRIRESASNIHETFSFYYPDGQNSLNAKYPCSQNVVAPQQAVCAKIVRAIKSNDGVWNTFEEEVFSFIVDANSKLNGFVQYHSKATKTCSDNSNMVELKSTLKNLN